MLQSGMWYKVVCGAKWYAVQSGLWYKLVKSSMQKGLWYKVVHAAKWCMSEMVHRV